MFKSNKYQENYDIGNKRLQTLAIKDIVKLMNTLKQLTILNLSKMIFFKYKIPFSLIHL